MENRLKPETKPVLHELKSANIRTIMVTGDNLKTACTVALNSGMVPKTSKLLMLTAYEPDGDSPAKISCQSIERSKDMSEMQRSPVNQVPKAENICGLDGSTWNYHCAMSGKTYETIKQHLPHLVPRILLQGTVFGRMTPKQKSNIIEDLQKIDYFVGMCGDGANDCGALKMAHAGISLSSLEASVASPFTSKIANIECVPKLLKEGRNTLVTSICLFKYLIMYTLIEFVCILLLILKQTLLGNFQYLLQDIAISVTVMLTMSLNGPPAKLSSYRPPMNFLSPPLLLSLALHVTFAVIIQASSFVMVQQQPWYNETDVFSACDHHVQSYVNHTMMEPSQSQNFLTTTLWPVSGIHLIIVELVFSKGKPFRKPIYTNYIYCILIMAQLGVFLFMLFADIKEVYSAMELVCTPLYWRTELLSMLLMLFVASCIVEVFVYNRNFWLMIKKYFSYKPKSQYKVLLNTAMKDDCSMWNGTSPTKQQFTPFANESV